ncbi:MULTISPECIES: CapA family protein [Leptolyngbya]|uniref:CapA family protein n=1 Tax=Leptolyngbya TaxID=47251 RepID=UPI001687DC7F|nr:CapA family protein [Leptolyngbya sp. FACHB-1624]MBD1854256.1 CapA family protein [Leptolyngbya sp. FACHB-1624]
MSYATESAQPSVLELARSGNPKAIAYWLNVFLLPHNLFAQAEPAAQPGCFKILIEFHPSPDVDARSPEFQQNLMRFVCHHMWKLNSDVIDGIQVVTRFIGKPQMLWRKTVRVVSPARRAKLAAKLAESAPQSAAPAEIKTRIQQVTRQKVQFRALRSLLLTGTTAAAFIIGCWLGYSDAPNEQKTATAANSTLTTRPDTIKTVLEPVQVNKVQADMDGTATILFGGDVALTKNYTELVKDDPKWAFAELEESRLADLSIVNLEAPFTTATDSKQAEPFKVDPAQVEVLKNGGIDVVNLANNRIMDYGSTGLDDTLKTLEQAGIRHFGAGRDEKEARRPEILEVDGQRVAYLGYYGSETQAATANQPGINRKHNDRIAADIQAIRDQVDWVIVNFHWGEEISKYPSDAQMELAHFSIDQGADLVIGHHSSILQGAELYQGRPIVYSLGNFIFGGKPESTYDSAMLRVALKDRQMKVELLPVEVNGFQPRIAHGDRAAEILHQIESVSDSFPQALKTPLVIDARTNTVTKPDGTQIESQTPISEPSKPESQPEQSVPEGEAPPAAESPTEEATPSVEFAPTAPVPTEQSAPAIEPSPDSSPVESPNPEQSAPTEEAPSSESQPGSPPSQQPWNNNSFINQNNESPAPMVPQQTSPSPQATQDPHTHLDDATRSPSTNSLEPIKRRYAEADRSDSQTAFNF